MDRNQRNASPGHSAQDGNQPRRSGRRLSVQHAPQEDLTYREKLLECARVASSCQHARYRPGVARDLGYLDNVPDERLRAIVRAWFKTDDVDALTREREDPMFVV